MTADAALVEIISEYVEGVDFTSAQFARYLAQALADFEEENPGLVGVTADEAVALLICHRIARKKSGAGEYSTERSGDWQGTRATAAGETSWLVAYRALLGKASVQPSSGVTRVDARASKAFALSDQKLPGVG
jgi:hypothetical protein